MGRGPRICFVNSTYGMTNRMLDIAETRLLQGLLIVPRVVLNELQAIADSSDKLRRARGRRGLDVLRQLQSSSILEVRIEEAEPEGTSVDQKLVDLAQQLPGRLITTDYNLAKVADLRGVEAVNLNKLAEALRPAVLPGERLRVHLVKPGESAGQGVGYLRDGTMVVVEQGRPHVGEEVGLTVTSVLQTSAGRMIFGQLAEDDGEDASHGSGAGREKTGTGSSTSSSGSDSGRAAPPAS
jgi:uncharacterized protein YacL